MYWGEVVENGRGLGEEVRGSDGGGIFVDWENKEKLKERVKCLNEVGGSIEEVI
ncbi:hypothetical protein [Bacillus pumilus]|uniref:hypothetical protein n=1 Tax=Bacillus pumilus TaxID=1408 RepID=UPI00164340A2|nr:hypothetical protein [Bacillus pumilus]